MFILYSLDSYLISYFIIDMVDMMVGYDYNWLIDWKREN